MPDKIIKSRKFQIVARGLAPDNKKRLSLSKALPGTGVTFNVYVNPLGQIILDPRKAVPAHEVWIFEDKAVLASIKRRLKQTAQGKTKALTTAPPAPPKTPRAGGQRQAINAAAGMWKNRGDLPDFQKLRAEWES